MKDIDIIIPYYNASSTIDRCLASIAQQTIADECTVTIVDDCSKDEEITRLIESVHKFQPLVDIQWIPSEENGGPGAARQAGLDETDCAYIVFADADDTLSSSYALQRMKAAMEGEKADVVCGHFVEESRGTFIDHAPNMVWVFGKMYRRVFLERHLIRFNDTRANEDTGFNTVVKSLTDRIVNISATVYEWHWADSTITRKDDAVYGWSNGHYGYIENMVWAVEELRKRNINKETIRALAVEVLCRLYFMHEDVLSVHPENAEESLSRICGFYVQAVRPIVNEGALPFCYISQTYGTIANETFKGERSAAILHRHTFRDYLRIIGYYDDYKATEE